LVLRPTLLQMTKKNRDKKVLNLGHTFAHDMRAILNFKIKHGTAVASGHYFITLSVTPEGDY